MLNLFAATGHTHYAKSARYYLQTMDQLPQTNPWLYEQFMKGNHTVKRTDNVFNTIWTDLAIEQTLMCSIKSRGGLTRGRGMGEPVRQLWVLSRSSSANGQKSLMELTGTNPTSNPQHADLGTSKKSLISNITEKF